jgi:hypothetical protein
MLAQHPKRKTFAERPGRPKSLAAPSAPIYEMTSNFRRVSIADLTFVRGCAKGRAVGDGGQEEAPGFLICDLRFLSNKQNKVL